MWLVTVVSFGIVEHLIDDQTFPTVWLGMWWALTTVTTVGYGDVVPQDASGVSSPRSSCSVGSRCSRSLRRRSRAGSSRAQRETPSDAEAELLTEIRELRARIEELAERPDR